MHQKAPTRQTALDLLLQYRSDSLINHGKAVEASMRYMARKADQDEETWGIIGLIHDLRLRAVSRSALYENRRNPARP